MEASRLFFHLAIELITISRRDPNFRSAQHILFKGGSSRLSDMIRALAGSSDYVEVRFPFPHTWQTLPHMAIFTNGETGRNTI